MRNVMLFVLLIVIAIFGYQMAAPYLIKKGVDMNVTALEDTNVEEIETDTKKDTSDLLP